VGDVDEGFALEQITKLTAHPAARKREAGRRGCGASLDIKTFVTFDVFQCLSSSMFKYLSSRCRIEVISGYNVDIEG
jgi:hypothetical protein